MIRNIPSLALLLFSGLIFQQTNAQTDERIYEIIDSVSADRIEADIRKLAGFGTRNTFSDTISDTRGIGAARRWIKSEFDNISNNCDNCLDVFYQKTLLLQKMANAFRTMPGW